jgi:hypothetical protein
MPSAAEKLSLSHLLGKDYNQLQKDLILAQEFEVAAVTGMGAGKTFALCVAAFRHCMKFPGANALISRLTFRELVDSTKRQFFELVDTKDLNEFIVLPKRWDYREGTNMVRFTNGSEITFANLEPGRLDKLKNIEYSWIGIDQAEEIGFDTYQILLFRCRLNAVPGNERKVISIANDEGDNWLRRRFLTFEQPHGRPTARATRRLLRSSSLDNPHLDEATRALYLSMPKEIQARYVYATMDAGSTRLIPDFRSIPGFEPPAHWPRFLGVDPARSTGVTCAIWVAVNPDETEYKGVKPNAPFIYREYWSEGRNAEDHAKAILDLTGPYPCRGRVMDRSAWSTTSLSKKSGSVNVAQMYINAGLGVAPSDGDEWARVALFLAAHKRGLVISEDCQNLRRQGPEYRVRGQAVFDHTGAAKNLKIVGKQHFHTVDAGGYALSVIPTRVAANDLSQVEDAYQIAPSLDRHSRLHWEADLAQWPKHKGRESIITSGLDDEFQMDETPKQWRGELEDALGW